MTDVICIGRNTKDVPLSKNEWDNFIREVTSLFSTLYFVGEGIGIYEDKKGDSYCCVGILNNKDLLSSLAKKYKQECIAYLCGETQFV
jgi:hypothetical protein